ncbi:hypothetical protein ACVWWK_006432 [Bradyrhizobium sp. LB9.1b]
MKVDARAAQQHRPCGRLRRLADIYSRPELPLTPPELYCSLAFGEDQIALSPVRSALCEWNAPPERVTRNNSKNREFDYKKSEKRERVMR